MEVHKNREWGDGARTYPEGMEIDCRQWKSFRVAEVRYNGVKIEYRLGRFDKNLALDVESEQPSSGSDVSGSAVGTVSAVANATHRQ